MDEKPRLSPPPSKRHGDELESALRKSGLIEQEESEPSRHEGQPAEDTGRSQAPEAPSPRR